MRESRKSRSARSLLLASSSCAPALLLQSQPLHLQGLQSFKHSTHQTLVCLALSSWQRPCRCLTSLGILGCEQMQKQSSERGAQVCGCQAQRQSPAPEAELESGVTTPPALRGRSGTFRGTSFFRDADWPQTQSTAPARQRPEGGMVHIFNPGYTKTPPGKACEGAALS